MKSASRSDGLWVFFALTFALSWVVWLVGVFTGMVNNQFPGVLLYLLGGSAPSIIGIILLYRYADPKERKDFWQRVIDFRAISFTWYLIIFLGFPVIMTISVVISLLLGDPMPGLNGLRQIAAQPLILIPMLIQGIISGPLLEELGWRGFALDRMIYRWGLLIAGPLLGIIWWTWHIPLFFFKGPLSIEYSFGFGTPLFWIYLISILSLAIIIAWAYSQNRRSILAAILIHLMYNFTPSLAAPINQDVRLIYAVVLLMLAFGLIIFIRQPQVELSGMRNAKSTS